MSTDVSWSHRLGVVRLDVSVPWLLLALAVGTSAWLQPNFFSPYSLSSSFASFLPLILVSVGQAVVIIGGGLDLSVGAILGLSSVVSLTAMDGRPELVALGVVAAVGTGAVCGLVNGLIVSVVRLQPLIATFATASVFTGMTLWVLPTPGGSVPRSITATFRTAMIGVPVTLWLVLLIAVLWLVLRKNVLMRRVYAVGGDPSAAFASLVPVRSTQTFSYTVAGGFAGLGALAVLANSGAGDPFVGGEFALNSIAAVIIGGVALRGGSGGGIGVIVGAIALSLVTSILFFLGIPTTYRQLAQGVIIIAALALSALSSGRT